VKRECRGRKKRGAHTPASRLTAAARTKAQPRVPSRLCARPAVSTPCCWTCVVPRSMAGVALVAPAQQGDDDWTVSNRQLIEPGGEGCWPVDPPLALAQHRSAQSHQCPPCCCQLCTLSSIGRGGAPAAQQPLVLHMLAFDVSKLCPDKKVFAAMPPMRYTEMHTVEYRQPPQFVWAWDPLFYTCPACDG
jgi:hypothetical protein